MHFLKKRRPPQPRVEHPRRPIDPTAGLSALALLALFAGRP